MTDREKMMLAAAAVRENPTPSDEMLTAMQAWLKKRDMTPEQAFGSSEFIREAYRLFKEQTNG